MKPHYQDDAVTLYHGDAAAVLAQLEPGSVDCIVTSPPYFGQRAYLADDDPLKPHELGDERTPAEFVEKLRSLFAEVRRVLADDGTLWLNLGDSYSTRKVSRDSSHQPGMHADRVDLATIGDSWMQNRRNGRVRMPADAGLPEKNLLGIPWRVAFALQDDGWILRQEIIWSKRSCMPEPTTDRPSRSHEQVFLFSKRARYWYDAEAIREESDNVNSAGIHSRPGRPGRNARSVWHLSMTPFRGGHSATMPTTLVDRCILAGCKPGGVVLDPFSGSGTTGMVAAKHGRRYVGIDLNRDYLDLSLRTRLQQPGLDLEGLPA